MRATLEQLKAMSDEQLQDYWFSSEFPFEQATCGLCLTEHVTHTYGGVFSGTYDCPHRELSEKSKSIQQLHKAPTGAQLREHLEEYFALRASFDSAYAKPAPQPEQAIVP